jgi:hypothetical protein
MRYLRVSIIVLVLVLAGIGIYYYLLVSGLISNTGLFGKKAVKPIETAVPFSYQQNSTPSAYGTKTIEYYGNKFLKSSTDFIEITGRIQPADRMFKTIDGENYSCIIGIISDSDKNLHRFWLTENQCNQLDEEIFTYFNSGKHAVLSLDLAGIKVNPASLVEE